MSSAFSSIILLDLAILVVWQSRFVMHVVWVNYIRILMLNLKNAKEAHHNCINRCFTVLN